ncbi:MAG: hypothetical protein Q7S28_04185 [bacterium]|nr:hypothetical protein [bacterium]
MKAPYLIQRCEIENSKLSYDYMGSSEFEWGDQAKSLKRIFAKGVAWASTVIRIQDPRVQERREHDVQIYMVARRDFSFVEYQPILQQLGEDKLRLKEASYFDTAIKAQLGFPLGPYERSRANVWFDFEENDVLWTLTKNKRKALVGALTSIEQKWATPEHRAKIEANKAREEEYVRTLLKPLGQDQE